MALDLLLIDDLHDLAKQYYGADMVKKQELDRDAHGLMFNCAAPSNIYYDIYAAFKSHYRSQFYEKQLGFTFE